MKVTIENHEGSLRLRWRYHGKRYTLACGVADSAIGRGLARQKASQIEADLITGQFDHTLLRYKPRILVKREQHGCYHPWMKTDPQPCGSSTLLKIR
ncbi:DUF3596 domain-containing protein [Synechococcales cyanobacterium C]|uniref:DUF3596 domain-containing protein n=1 Tax=Petrachloros mirabilis ULC683 TaxID=2781853 RepID=A0A8K1ZVU5_9CYAN|nr:DUF3596 domain-containing protein [Petrachloros mirabilis]NCJ05052.1 DUF3596 domain-containing protein [Petrachloros mirabilis ULC683]